MIDRLGAARFLTRLWQLRQSRGQSLVEMAVLVPILLMMTLGSIDLGRIYFANIAITNAAREGAADLALSHQKYTFATAIGRAQVRNAVFQRVVTETAKTLDLGTNNSLITVTVAPSVPPYTPTDRVTVTVGYSFTLLFLAPVTQLVSDWWGGPALQATSRISYTSGFPVIAGALTPLCSGGAMTITPTAPIQQALFSITPITITFDTTRFSSASNINVNWDTVDGASPGVPMASRSPSLSYSFTGQDVINASGNTATGSHYIYGVQPATNRCASAVVTLICNRLTSSIGTITVPPNEGVYYHFTAGYAAPGSVTASGTFPNTGSYQATVELYRDHIFSEPLDPPGGPGSVSSSERDTAQSSNLLASAPGTNAETRTAGYTLPGTAYGGGPFTVLYFNPNPTMPIDITFASVEACDLTQP